MHTSSGPSTGRASEIMAKELRIRALVFWQNIIFALLIVGFWLSDYALGSVIALSLVVIILNAGIIGAAVPLTLKKFNVDPAIATGPFVTTSNDILSLLVYLGLVTLFLTLSS